MSLSEIETAIKKLPKQDLEQFDQWYQDYLEEQWDEQIRRDICSGKLDALRSEERCAEPARTIDALLKELPDPAKPGAKSA